MTKHLFTSDCDGGLYDTRNTNWSHEKPLRSIYSKHFKRIGTIAELKATIRAGQYAWPGGYQLYFVTKDGYAISFDAAKADFETVLLDWDQANQIVGCEINYEDDYLFCDYTENKIDAAYI